MKQQRDMAGVLFRNDRKTTEGQPDYTGYANLSGINYRVGGWIKSSERGKFLSLNFRVDDQQRQAPPSPAQGGIQEMTDDIPF